MINVFPHSFFFFLQGIDLLVLNNVWIQIYLICSYAFYCYFLFAFLWSCILPSVHERYSGLALTSTGEVHVVQTNETTGSSQEMLPTCSKIHPMELVLDSSRVSIGELITSSGDPSLEVQPFSQLWPSLHPITSSPDPKTQPACSRDVCQHSSIAGVLRLQMQRWIRIRQPSCSLSCHVQL